MDDIAIKVNNVSKSFKLPHERHSSVKNMLFSMLKGRKRTYEKQKVLNDISFNIKKGEFFGIVGRNGSGKSTLLKLLAGIYSPDYGSITINGKLTPFIELGVGFNPELTGRENIFLNGALLGFSRIEMEDMYDEIVKFAELEKFMDQQLKNYSSGMQVRLAFSIAIRANTEILLLDEVLAVGDANFQQKCLNYFKQLKREKKTVILVSHDMNTVRNYCTNALLLSDGKIVKIDKPSSIVNEYDRINIDYLESNDTNSQSKNSLIAFGNGDAEIVGVETKKENKQSNWFGPNDNIKVGIKFLAKKDLKSPVIGMTLTDSQGLCVFATNTIQKKNVRTGLIKKGSLRQVVFEIDAGITDGEYSISCAVANEDRTISFARIEDAHRFSVTGWEMSHSMFHPKHEITLTKN